MLVLTRKLGEEIMIGDDIRIFLVRICGNQVRLAIEAPRGIRILRGEIFFKLKEIPAQLETIPNHDEDL